MGQPGELTLVTHGPKETRAAAAQIATLLQPRDIVLLSGELGSGKTTFVRGACRALGVRERVTSPTYTIGHRYEGNVPVSHLDLYRFEGISPAEWGDLEPYFEDAVVFVEWPEAAGDDLPPPRVAVRLEHSGSARILSLESAEESLLDRAFGSADARP